MDWAWTLEGDQDASAIRAALELAAGAEEKTYIEAPEASRALAAATVVAAAAGRPTRDELPNEALVWLREQSVTVDADMIDTAQRAVARVRRASELRELWDEAGADEWLARVEELQSQLGEHS